MPFNFSLPIRSHALGGPGGGVVDAYNYFTANTPEQKLQAFAQGPAIDYMGKIHQATTAEDVAALRDQMHQDAAKAGVPLSALPGLDQILVAPSLANMNAQEVKKLIDMHGSGAGVEYSGPQPAGDTTPTDASETPAPGTFAQAPLAQPKQPFNFSLNAEKPYSQNDLMRASALGMKPNPALLEVPSNVDYKTAQAKAENAATSQKMSAQNLAEQEARDKQKQLGTLSERPGPGGVSPRAAATISPPSVNQFFAKPLAPEETQLKQSQIGKNQAQTARYNAMAKAVGGSAKMGAYFNEYTKLGGDPENEEAFLNYVTKRSKASRKPDMVEQFLNSSGGQQGGNANPKNGQLPTDPAQRRQALRSILGGGGQ